MDKKFDFNAEAELKKKFNEAEELLKDSAKIERFLIQLEEKLKVVPLVGDELARVSVLVSILYSYFRKEYTEIPTTSLIVIAAALLYFLNPFDIIPDAIPLLGYVDDLLVVGVCWKIAEADIKAYEAWRKARHTDEV